MKQRTGNRLLAMVVLCLTNATVALAGEFYEKDGIAIKGYDLVAYFREQATVKGSESYTTVYRGSVFHFASATHRDTFVANPEQFAPQYGGFCALGTAKGYKATTDPAAFTVTGDKLYLNYSETVRSQWMLDIPGYIRKADANWPEVKKLTKVHE